VAIASAISLLPPLLTGTPLGNVLFHSSRPLILLGVSVLVMGVWLASRRAGELNVAAKGVTVRSGATTYFYDWADVDKIDQTKGGVRLSLHGRTNDQNAYNVISARFVGKVSDLYDLMSDGLARFGAERPGGGQSHAPGDDLRRASRSSLGWIFGVIGALFGGVFLLIVVSAASGCIKTVALQKHGRATDARVVRVYTDSCGKNGCSENVEYTYNPQPDGPIYHGYSYIANSRSRYDPDLLFAETRHTVPIVYNTEKPGISSLNFRNRIFTQDAVKTAFTMVGVMAGIEAFVLAIFAACLAPVLMKASSAKPFISLTSI
jgi:hypothetical protein